MTRFLLDDETITLDDAPADLTVLDWLRLHRGRSGTKEGCGSGDCGACTVVVVRAVEPRGGPAAERADGEGDVPTAAPAPADVLRYDSINACIAFVGSLHGCQLLSVESLERGGRLHPVQQAMLDEHGSQCGFCTPGFIMSMFALGEAPDAPVVRWRPASGRIGESNPPDRPEATVAGQARATPVAESRSPSVNAALPDDTHADAVITGSNPSASRPLSAPAGWLHGLEVANPLALSHRIDRALGGNLCRCTGYRPIKRATAVSLAERTPWLDADASAALAKRLRGLRDAAEGTPASWTGGGWCRPATLTALADLVQARPDARLVAGATDLALDVTQGVQDLPCLVATAAVPELQELIEHDGVLSIGAAVSLSRLEAVFADRLPEAARLLLRFGSDPVRNAGTLGGNVCSASPIGDLPPLLLALDATLVLQQGHDARELRAEHFFLDYRKTALQAGEFLRAVRLPLPGASTLLAIHKVSKRMDDDISTVCGAFCLCLDEQRRVSRARLAFGGMAAIPRRAPASEAALVGRPFDVGAADAAAACLARDFAPIDDARASGAYRLQVAANLLRRTAIEQSSPEAPSRVADLEADYLATAAMAADPGRRAG